MAAAVAVAAAAAATATAAAAEAAAINMTAPVEKSGTHLVKEHGIQQPELQRFGRHGGLDPAP